MLVPLLSAAIPADAPRWRRVFPGRPCQAAAVRRFLAALLYGHPMLDEMLLAANELVANALKHTASGGPDGSFTVEVRHCDAWTMIAVADQGGWSEPMSCYTDDLAESGRGLRTVAALADGWGWFGNVAGRTVIAVFRPADPV